MNRERAAEIIGMGVHTGLRKGTEAPRAHDLWKQISDLEDSAWNDALLYCVDTLRELGYEIVAVS